MVNARFPAGDARAMGELETLLAQLLSGEGGRCAFLRSHSYLTFRLAALYRNHAAAAPLTVWAPSGDVRLEYTPDPSGGYITLCSAPVPFHYAND
jgi:hypothetical protein